MPPGLVFLIGAQFASALADQALLILTIALLHDQGWALWWAPLLKVSFNLAYVVLAPVAGPLADAWPKARLMAWMNALKLLGVLALLAGVHPLLAFALVGLGAAGYAPAKYGLLTELVAPQQLVGANSWLEVSVVGAALLGAVLGGVLVNLPWRSGALLGVLLLYALAAGLNWGVPRSGARYPASSTHPGRLLREFWQDHLRLWRDAAAGLCLAVTTLFWGLGATLQFAVLHWADAVLGLPLAQAAYLQAAVAVGVVLGAWAAARVPLAQAPRVLWAGVALGLLLPLMAYTTQLAWALPLLVLVGAVGGVLVVPLNALLQHRGHALLSAGRSIAVQGFNENASVLLMLGAYAGVLALELPIVPVIGALGLATALGMLCLIGRGLKLAPARPSLHSSKTGESPG